MYIYVSHINILSYMSLYILYTHTYTSPTRLHNAPIRMARIQKADTKCWQEWNNRLGTC